MKFKLLFLFFILLPIITFCQGHNVSFESVLNRLTNKTWVKKICKDDICQIKDSNYYFFPVSFTHIDDVRKTKCIHLENYGYYRDADANKIKFSKQDCNPIICFCDSSAFKNTYTIYANINGGAFGNGKLTFVSDSEFYYTLFEHTTIYKAINPPREVLSVVPR